MITIIVIIIILAAAGGILSFVEDSGLDDLLGALIGALLGIGFVLATVVLIVMWGGSQLITRLGGYVPARNLTLGVSIISLAGCLYLLLRKKHLIQKHGKALYKTILPIGTVVGAVSLAGFLVVLTLPPLCEWEDWYSAECRQFAELRLEKQVQRDRKFNKTIEISAEASINEQLLSAEVTNSSTLELLCEFEFHCGDYSEYKHALSPGQSVTYHFTNVPLDCLDGKSWHGWEIYCHTGDNSHSVKFYKEAEDPWIKEEHCLYAGKWYCTGVNRAKVTILP